MSIIIYGAERSHARWNDDNRRMLSARYIHMLGYLHKNLRHFTAGTKAALVLCEPEVESRRRKAKIYLAARFRFRRNERRKKGKEQKGYIFSEKGVTRGRRAETIR